ncbi:MAG: hypothetical protein O7A69_05060 [SAR324 cluster bacterium]|nr:hypothetical protein [SAR324 cluster bacterium]MCZ6646233.1 hypothetical protein [SAR324 cluster bacterium]
MSPETQDLEQFFQQIQKPDDAPGTAPEFDSFFEKLSSIDDLVLSADAGGTPAPQPAPVTTNRRTKSAPKYAKQSTAQPKARQKMEVLRSDHLDNMNKKVIRARKFQNGLLTAMKLGVAGLLLFGVGLASGWMALSLPNRVQVGPTSVFEIPATGKTSTAAAEQVGDRMDMIENDAIVRDDEDIVGIDTPVIAAAPAVEAKTASALKTHPSGNAARSAKSDPEFAIQVGACQSRYCVDAYRKLLLNHVSSDAIQVIERPNAGTNATIQRIRVISSNRSDARKLKAVLATADARFKDAYVIALPRSPSS